MTTNKLGEYTLEYQKSINQPNEFWAELASTFNWRQKWEKVSQGNFTDLKIKYFDGGKLNISENCLDRHCQSQEGKNKIAIYFEPNNPSEKGLELTYGELLTKVSQFANVLKNKGVQKGDRICFYMGMVPELLYGVLASARIGAIHSVVFGGFSSNALAERINDCQAKILVTCDGAFRGDKIVQLKEMADQALINCPGVKTCLVLKRTENQIQMKKDRDHWLTPLIDSAKKECPVKIMDAEDPLFILYTSGSTGKPKGQIHSTGGYMVWAGYTFKKVFGVDQKDLFWCTADIGWITGHTYLAYGPLLNGVSQVMFEGIPTWPDPSRFWQVVDKYKVTHFYTAPTAIRSLEAMGLSHIEKHRLDSLKVLGTVGEPINQEAWDWYNINIGKKRCPIVDTWWQTETGGIMISPLWDSIPKPKPSFATKPLPGVLPVLMNEEGAEVEGNGKEGALCIKNPWPGVTRGIWGDPNRFRDVYFTKFPGYYFTGDGAKRDMEGDYRITGRIDDLIKVSGHLLSTAEIEDSLNAHPNVVESAVVGRPHDIKGNSIYAFIISPDPKKYDLDKDKFNKELNDHISKTLGPVYKPDTIQLVEGLPKTRSGKIMRRILRKIAAGELKDLGDTSTLVNPEIVEKISQGRI